MSSRMFVGANPRLERLRRLFDTVETLPVPDGPVVPQLRSLLFGSRMAEIALTSETCRIPREVDCLWILDHLRTQGDIDDLHCFEDLLIDAGYGKWVSRSQVMALLRAAPESWNHPALVLGRSYSRFRLAEMIEWVDELDGSESATEAAFLGKIQSVRGKLEKTQALEEKASRRRQVLRNGYRKPPPGSTRLP